MPTSSFKYLIIPFVLVAVSLFYILFPGYYSADSIAQYEQILGGSYNDMQSPVFTFVWKLLYSLTGKSYSIFLVQMILYWLFFYLLLFKITRHIYVFIPGLILASLIVFIPQCIIADTHAAISWGIAFLLIVLLYRNGIQQFRKAAVIAAFFLIIYGASFRLNNIAGAALLFYLLLDVVSKQPLTYFRKVSLTVILSVAVMFCSHLFVYQVLSTEHHYPNYKSMLLDIAGIDKRIGDNFIPEDVQTEAYVHDYVMTNYTPATIEAWYYPDEGTTPMFKEPDEKLYDTLRQYWRAAVHARPTNYIENRWDGFMYYLGLQQYHTKRTHDVSTNLTASRVASIAPINNNVLSAFYIQMNTTIVHTPWLWLLFNLLLFIYSVRSYNNKKQPEYRLQILMQLSAIFFIFSILTVYDRSHDFRYCYWNIVAAVTGALHCIHLYIENKKKSKRTL